MSRSIMEENLLTELFDLNAVLHYQKNSYLFDLNVGSWWLEIKFSGCRALVIAKNFFAVGISI